MTELDLDLGVDAGQALARETGTAAGSQPVDRTSEEAATRGDATDLSLDRGTLAEGAERTEADRARRGAERGGSQLSEATQEDRESDVTEDRRTREGNQPTEAAGDKPPPRTSGPGVQQDGALVHSTGKTYPGAARINR